MGKTTDVRPVATSVYLLPLKMRTPLKFGLETVTDVTCARACMTVVDAQGRAAKGWGETPLGVQWAWPSILSYEQRFETMVQFCIMLAEAWAQFDVMGHPMEIGYAFQEQHLPRLLSEVNQQRGSDSEPMPWLAALVCCSAFDLALHDAYGVIHQRPVYEMYGPDFMNRDLGDFLTDADGSPVRFKGKYPQDFLMSLPPDKLDAWHVVGGGDPLDPSEFTGSEPEDGYPVLLADWIASDGRKCLKLKLRGNDAEWDYERTVKVGKIAVEKDVDWLSPDFNCTVTDPAYINGILDSLLRQHPQIYGMILYVEQPFPYDLEKNPIDVHSVSARKPLFMDESAHDWRLVRLGRELGWSGVALKTCKTQTGAILSLCWAKVHGMTLTVQDLTNPMIAQIPHVLLAAYAGTVMGLDTNSMQFYPEASAPEALIHPGLYQRRGGKVDLSTIRGPGFGYRLAEIKRDLPPPAVEFIDPHFP